MTLKIATDGDLISLITCIKSIISTHTPTIPSFPHPKTPPTFPPKLCYNNHKFKQPHAKQVSLLPYPFSYVRCIMEETFFVSLDIYRTSTTIDNAVINGSITGERIDHYQIDAGTGACIVAIYEKYYYRSGNRLTLTVTIDDFPGKTRVHCVAGGGREGLFRFDWGASKSFSSVAQKALAPYRI